MNGHLSISKYCSCCKRKLLTENFHKDSKGVAGFSYICKKCSKLQHNVYYLKNKEIINKKHSEYVKKNKEYIRKYKNEYQRNRLKSDPEYRALHCARNRIRYFLKNKNKFSKSIGCSFDEFRNHIENLFKPGMSWNNYGEWQIDHIYPLSRAYEEGSESFSKACNYKNLQPLWKNENNIKGDKV